MMHALLTAGLRLAEALRAENAALAAMDLGRAAGITAAKARASDAFAAAWAAAQKTGARPGGEEAHAAATALADRLAHLSAENRRLLEYAITLQAKVIETIAGAALPRASPPTYGASGLRPAPRVTPAVAFVARV
ncbi:hypothetical protein C8P66_11080 [Humitalea rosea]|uniref:Uncharacterized protein n=1 Tax=Humitalea rosea TaxID=990373 RepID=A0A2W7IJJ8_9PROT|nr:hypothetical protein [Humitalea rosea]PZW45882.1 hypothetical protein C8P66_11080 [Humitalea rosea]